jgi:Zn finger protein HypA/HybF involved in hydrogenase expression
VRKKLKVLILKTMATVGYCVKCKAKRDMKDEKEVSMKGKGSVKRRAMTGICTKCGTKMYKILGKAA